MFGAGWLLRGGVVETNWMPNHRQSGAIMVTYFVATLARCVLVDAEDETNARELGRVALQSLQVSLRQRLGSEVPINIQVVRPATDDEIELCSWNEEAFVRD